MRILHFYTFMSGVTLGSRGGSRIAATSNMNHFMIIVNASYQIMNF